jgi:dTDP-4-amino-4,6-dideoxygalactose transaminase
MSSGTTALMLLARALGLRGEVIVPSFTFVATAHALEWLGLVPVFCDIDPESWTLDPRACEAAITPATSAILGVHLFGRPCDATRLREVADRHGLPLCFDAAHAFGCSHEGRAVGSLGTAEVFSFHATKAFHTFEGGAVTTARDDVASALRLLRNFGFRGFDDVSRLGVNGKMPEVCAAMGLSNLEAFGTIVVRAMATFDAYRAELAGLPGLRLRDYTGPDRRNWHYVVLEIDEPAFGLSRDALARVLQAENVLARRYFHPGVHAMEPYRTRDPRAGLRLPVTVRAVARALALPAGCELPAADVAAICEIVRSAQIQATEVLEALESTDESLDATTASL